MVTSDYLAHRTRLARIEQNKILNQIKQAILGTTGVTALVSYSSTLNHQGRVLTVSGVAQSLYSQTPFSTQLNV